MNDRNPVSWPAHGGFIEPEEHGPEYDPDLYDPRDYKD